MISSDIDAKNSAPVFLLLAPVNFRSSPSACLLVSCNPTPGHWCHITALAVLVHIYVCWSVLSWAVVVVCRSTAAPAATASLIQGTVYGHRVVFCPTVVSPINERFVIFSADLWIQTKSVPPSTTPLVLCAVSHRPAPPATPLLAPTCLLFFCILHFLHLVFIVFLPSSDENQSCVDRVLIKCRISCYSGLELVFTYCCMAFCFLFVFIHSIIWNLLDGSIELILTFLSNLNIDTKWNDTKIFIH